MVPVEIKLDEEYETELKEIHFLDLFEVHYQEKASIISFYDQYRNVIIASLKKKGDIIMWQNNMVLDGDEELSPTFEEIILANVLFLIDSRLPGHVKDVYKITGRAKSLMDYRPDILSKVPTFLTEITNTAHVISKRDIDQHAR
jgi:hypothetical protein